MGTTNFDTVSVTGAVQVNGTNVVVARGNIPSFVNNDAPNNSARINAIVSELTNIGIIA